MYENPFAAPGQPDPNRYQQPAQYPTPPPEQREWSTLDEEAETLERLIEAGSPVIVDYPPTQRTKFGQPSGPEIPGQQIDGITLIDAAQRHEALSVVARHLAAEYSHPEVVITGTRDHEGQSKQVSVIIRHSEGGRPDPASKKRTRFVVVGESKDTIDRPQTLSEDGKTLTIDGQPVQIDGFHLLPRVEENPDPRSMKRSRLTLGGLRKVLSARKYAGIPHATLPQLKTPR